MDLNIILAKTKNRSEHYLSKNKEQIYLMNLLLSSFLYAQKKLQGSLIKPSGVDLIMIL